MKSHKIIAILYFVLAGLCLANLAFLAVHYYMMDMVMNIDMPVDQTGEETPDFFKEFFEIMNYIYLFLAVIAIAFALLYFFTGLFLLKLKNRTFVIVGSAISCLFFPFGTALGVWSLITLLSDEGKLAFGNSFPKACVMERLC